MLLLAFSAVLLLAVLVSQLANRTILSTSVLFLVAGFILGDGVMGVVKLEAGDHTVGTLAELALLRCCLPMGCASAGRTYARHMRCPGEPCCSVCR